MKFEQLLQLSQDKLIIYTRMTVTKMRYTQTMTLALLTSMAHPRATCSMRRTFKHML